MVVIFEEEVQGSREAQVEEPNTVVKVAGKRAGEGESSVLNTGRFPSREGGVLGTTSSLADYFVGVCDGS